MKRLGRSSSALTSQLPDVLFPEKKDPFICSPGGQQHLTQTPTPAGPQPTGTSRCPLGHERGQTQPLPCRGYRGYLPWLRCQRAAAPVPVTGPGTVGWPRAPSPAPAGLRQPPAPACAGERRCSQGSPSPLPLVPCSGSRPGAPRAGSLGGGGGTLRGLPRTPKTTPHSLPKSCAANPPATGPAERGHRRGEKGVRDGRGETCGRIPRCPRPASTFPRAAGAGWAAAAVGG